MKTESAEIAFLTSIALAVHRARRFRRSMIITSNLVFDEWDRIFKNPMTTAAASGRASEVE